MRLLDWYDWRAATGAAKTRCLQKLLRDNEPLVLASATRFLSKTALYAGLLRDDVLQAARIGLLKAIQEFDGGSGGGFRSIAWHKMRFEMQKVMRDALPISHPRDVMFAKGHEHAAAAFYAQHGRDPEPGEVTVSAFIARRPPRQPAKFVSVTKAEGLTDRGLKFSEEEPRDPEGDIDRQRDEANLRLWLSKQTKVDQKEFWTGKRPDLTERATKFIAARRRALPRRVP